VRDEWPRLGEGLAFDPRRFSLPSGRTAHRHPTPDMAPLYTCPGCIRQLHACSGDHLLAIKLVIAIFRWLSSGRLTLLSNSLAVVALIDSNAGP
jgi:hypothetical protein